VARLAAEGGRHLIFSRNFFAAIIRVTLLTLFDGSACFWRFTAGEACVTAQLGLLSILDSVIAAFRRVPFADDAYRRHLGSVLLSACPLRCVLFAVTVTVAMTPIGVTP
jgi:hypothetical protein